MAHYLVEAELIEDRANELRSKVSSKEFRDLEPFGRALSYSLENARFDPEKGVAVWEEVDYCNPPLNQEREAVLDEYFSELEVQKVGRGQGWEEIDHLPALWDSHPIFRN
jgi:hypothetical protein